MKNSLADLNNHLFAQLERLGDEELKDDALDLEAKRAEAIVGIADQIIRNAALQIQAAKIAHDAGVSPIGYLPAPAMKTVEGAATRTALPASFPIKVGARAP